MSGLLEISGPTVEQELLWRDTLINRSFDGVTVAAIMTELVGLASDFGWTVSVSAPYSSMAVTVRFDARTAWAAILEVAKVAGAHVRVNPIAREIQVGAFGSETIMLVGAGTVSPDYLSNPDVGLVLGVQVREDSSGVWNQLIPLGAGEGVNLVTLQYSTRPAQLLTNPSAEAGTSPWSATNAALAVTLDRAKHGTRSLRVSRTGADNYAAGQLATISGATLGRVYSASGWIYVPAGPESFVVEVGEVGGAFAEQTTSTAYVLATGWNYVTGSRTLARDDRTGVRATYRQTGAIAGDYFDLDATVLQLAAVDDLDPHITQLANPDGSTAYAIEDQSSIATVTAGRARQRALPFKDIAPIANGVTAHEAAANTLYDLANTFRKNHRAEVKQYTIRAMLPSSASALVGDSLHVLYRGWAENEDGTGDVWLELDDDLVLLEKRLNYGRDGMSVYTLTVSNLAQWLSSAVEVVLGELESLGAMRTAVKLYTMMLPHHGGRESIETSSSTWFDFHIRYNAAVHLVHAVWLDVDIKALKSNVLVTSTKAAAIATANPIVNADNIVGVATEDHTHSVWTFRNDGALGGASAERSYDGFTLTNPPANSSGASFRTESGVGSFGTGEPRGQPGGVNVADDSHTHPVTIPAHDHDLEYGIFLDSMPSPATWQIWINGVDVTGALGGPWTADVAQLDVTRYLQDAGGQPLRQDNVIQIRTSASKAFDVEVNAQSLASVSAIGAP